MKLGKLPLLFLFISINIFINNLWAQPAADNIAPLSDREQKAKSYLEEFSSGEFQLDDGKIYRALLNALSKIPLDVYEDITGRNRPIIFVHYYTTTIARYATSAEFTVEPNGPPAFQNGFFLVKLGDALLDAPDVETIEGVIYHEIAHRVLENLKREGEPCDLEKDANELVKKWGFEKEFAKAKHFFGAKEKSDSPCFDYTPPNPSEETAPQ